MSYRQDLWDVASTQHGILSTADAADVGVPAVEVRKLAARGALESVARRVYRHQLVPTDRFTQPAAAVAAVGKGAYLRWDTVLSLYDLAAVDPPTINVEVARRYRGTPPPHVRVATATRPVPQDVTTHDGVPGVTVARALLDAIAHIPHDRVEQAADEAEARGLLTPGERRRVELALAHRTPPTLPSTAAKHWRVAER